MKRVASVVLALAIICSAIVPVFASGFGGGSRPGSFGTSGFGASTQNTRLSWDALSELCVKVNEEIANGKFTESPVSGATNLAATIYFVSATGGDVYVISLLKSGTRYTFHNKSGGTYFCYADDAPVSLYTTLVDIKSYTSNISSKINTVSTNITQVLSALNYMVQNWDKTYYTSYSTDANDNPFPTQQVTYDEAVNLVAILNGLGVGKKIQYINYGGISGTYLFRFAYLYNGYIRVVIDKTDYSDYFNVYLCTKDRKLITWNRNNSGSGGTVTAYDDTILLDRLTELGAKIDRIYNWLDNADLTTNSTIVNIVNNSSQSVEDALPNFDRVRGLFWAAYSPTDDNHVIGDWASAIDYFNTVWSGGQ